jgi:katanin p60 ATPase-containing subunit A1
MSTTVGDILENVKLARENALLGNYDTSQVYYQGAVQQIQKLVMNVTDPVIKQKWQQVCEQHYQLL